MEDVQNYPAALNIPIDQVGIRNHRLPLFINERSGRQQTIVATVELGVNLTPEFKGTHMSRFISVLQSIKEPLNYQKVKSFLIEMRDSLESQKARLVLAFPYFFSKTAPSTKHTCLQGYDCCFYGDLDTNGKITVFLEVCVPVMTVCPCSKAISDEGAHSQRADVRIKIELKDNCWIEDIVEIADSSGSSPTYPLLKRADEKFVTENAFSHPMFVEDVVRHVASELQQKFHLSQFYVEVESYESIHAHNAFARIERGEVF